MATNTQQDPRATDPMGDIPWGSVTHQQEDPWVRRVADDGTHGGEVSWASATYRPRGRTQTMGDGTYGWMQPMGNGTYS